MISILKQNVIGDTYATEYILETDKDVNGLSHSPNIEKNSIAISKETGSIFILSGDNIWEKVGFGLGSTSLVDSYVKEVNGKEHFFLVFSDGQVIDTGRLNFSNILDTLLQVDEENGRWLINGINTGILKIPSPIDDED